MIRQSQRSRWICRIFVPKIVRNGKKISPVRLGDEKDASAQGKLRYPRRLPVGVVGRGGENQANP